MKLILGLSSLGMVGYLLEIGNAGVPDWRRASAFSLQAVAGGLFLWACAATRRIGLGWRFPGAIRSGYSTLARFALFAILFICLILYFGSPARLRPHVYS